MNKQTKDQIAREAEAYFGDSPVGNSIIKTLRTGYISGAETWADRGEVLAKALEKLSQFGGYVGTVATEALSNYNNPVK